MSSTPVPDLRSRTPLESAASPTKPSGCPRSIRAAQGHQASESQMSSDGLEIWQNFRRKMTLEAGVSWSGADGTPVSGPGLDRSRGLGAPIEGASGWTLQLWSMGDCRSTLIDLTKRTGHFKSWSILSRSFRPRHVLRRQPWWWWRRIVYYYIARGPMIGGQRHARGRHLRHFDPWSVCQQ